MSYRCPCGGKYDCRDSRPRMDGAATIIRRRYNCPSCGNRLYTEERIVGVINAVGQRKGKVSDHALASTVRHCFEISSDGGATWRTTSYRALGLTTTARRQLAVGPITLAGTLLVRRRIKEEQQ